jgi:hypothetical protein
MISTDLFAHDDLAPRGVYRSRVLDEQGNTVLVAVDSRHRRVPQAKGGIRSVMPGDNPLTVAEEMWDLLNELDPVPPPSKASESAA